MRSVLRLELLRAFGNRTFVLVLAVGILLAVVHVALVPFQYAFADIWTYWRQGFGGTYPPSLYSSWIGQTPYSVVTIIFFHSLPLLACIPFADSLCSDLTSRYALQLISRSGRTAYFIAKPIAVALSSGAVALIPLLLNILLTACCVPALPPEPAAGTSLVSSSSMLASVYYDFPLAHIAAFVLIACLLSAAFGLFSTATSFFTTNRFIVVLLPFAICVALNFIMQGTVLAGFSPINIMLPYQPFPSILWVVVLIILLLWAVPVVVLRLRGRMFEDV